MAKQVLEGWGRDTGQSPQICQGFPHLLGGPCLSPGPRAAWKDPLPNGRQLASAPLTTAKHLTHSLEAVQHMGGDASPLPAFLAARRPLEGSSRAAMLQWLWENFSAFRKGPLRAAQPQGSFQRGCARQRPPIAWFPSSCRPILLVRAARHYEGAEQILIRRAILLSSKFIGFWQVELPALGCWVRVECPARIDLSGR